MTHDLKLVPETPDGFSLEHDVVQPDVWATIQHWLSSNMLPDSSTNERIYVPIPWETGHQMQGRKVAQFGNCRYDYVADVADQFDNPSNDDDDAPPPIPDYIRQTLLNGEQNCQQYTQCIINMYEANNEIPWHLDHEYFGPEVLVYTFGENRPLLLRKPVNGDENIHNQEKEDKVYIYSRSLPRHCSKYALSGPARHVWEHSIPSGKGERVSITFRSWVGPK